MGSNLLQAFWDLSSNEEAERIEAAKELLLLLQEQQHAVSPQDQGQDQGCAELDYTLQRLVKGLSSNRKSARQGFYIALTQLLVQFPQLSAGKVLQLVHTHLEPGGGAKAAEERGACFGKGFALLALVSSGILSSEEEFVEVAKQLVSVEKRKSFLVEFCASIACQLLEACPQDICRDSVLLSELGLGKGWEDCPPERLQGILCVSKLYGKRKWFVSYLQKYWATKHLWCLENFEPMKDALMASSASLPRLHGVWPLLLDTVRVRGHFGEFWKIVVDEGLVMSSHERRYVSFQLLQSLLPTLSANEVGVVFSPNLMGCLMNNSRSSGNYLYPVARHLLGELESCLRTVSDQKLLVTLFTHLQRRTSNKFDQLMGSKVIGVILDRIDLDGVDELLKNFQRLLSGEQQEGQPSSEESQEQQLWAADQLVGVVRNSHLPRAGPWLVSAATLLLGHAFFSIPPSCAAELPSILAPPPAVVGPSLRISCQLKFTSVLTDLSTLALPRPHQEGVAHRHSRLPPGLMEDGTYFISSVFQVAQQLIAKGVELVQPFSREEQSAWDVVCRSVQALADKGSLELADKAFLLLFSAVGLGLLNPAERGGACRNIMELEGCHGDFQCSLKPRTPRKKPGAQWMEVLTDLMLSFLSLPSQLWRNVMEQAFKLLTGHVTLECLQLILAVLEPKQLVEDVMEEAKEEDEEEEEGKEEDDEEEDVMEEAKEEDDEEEGDEVEEGEEAKEEEDDSDVSSNEEGEGLETGGGVDPAFAEAVRRALGAAVGSDGESEASLSDDAMMAVDEALGEVFRSRFALKHHKKQQKDDDKSLLHFKLRALDLVEIFLQKEPTNPLIFELILPLHELVQASHGTQSYVPLVERAAGLFRSRLCGAKVYPKMCVDIAYVHDKLRQLLQCLYKANPTTSPLVTAGCMFLVRVLRGCVLPPLVSPVTTRAGRKRKQEERGGACPQGQEKGVSHVHGQLDVPLVTQWFADALHDFITVKNSRVAPAFFITYIDRYPSLACLLLPKLVEDLPSAANHFKKTQVVKMVAVLLSEGGDEGAWQGLSPGDAAAVRAVIARAGKKRTKRKKKMKIE